MSLESIRVFGVSDLLQQQRSNGEPWYEFLRVERLRTGLYVLAAGAWDAQTPHEEDEVYHVISGRASFQAGDRRWPVAAGSIIFVPAWQAHRFTDIEEELTVFVYFAAGQKPPPSR
jgi:mannose-6-phosphate isomerase-like protein (cupin superfamily)